MTPLGDHHRYLVEWAMGYGTQCKQKNILCICARFWPKLTWTLLRIWRKRDSRATLLWERSVVISIPIFCMQREARCMVTIIGAATWPSMPGEVLKWKVIKFSTLLRCQSGFSGDSMDSGVVRLEQCGIKHMGVSMNGGIPKMMVYNGKFHLISFKWMIWGTPISGNLHMYIHKHMRVWFPEGFPGPLPPGDLAAEGDGAETRPCGHAGGLLVSTAGSLQGDAIESMDSPW